MLKVYYSETTHGKYVTNHHAIKGIRTFDDDSKIVSQNIRRKAKSGRYIAILDVYPDKTFKSSRGACVCVYFFDKIRYHGLDKEDLIRIARYGY